MTLIPRPRRPEEPSEPFNFEEWDKAHFRRAGELLAQLAQRREGEQSMRDALLRLYFQEGAGDADPSR